MTKNTTGPIRIIDGFYPHAKDLRDHFVKRYQNPYEARSDRFVWDFWQIKNQYRLLRTPAESFFPKSLFQPFLKHLFQWSRQNLGCQMISHPWLSAYLDGSYQNLHSDVPHGPWAFVYSLTDWTKREFEGGQTLIAKPKLLRFFDDLSPDISHEHSQLFESITPKFNRLMCFDPRYPHGVERVSGQHDLIGSRLVIHGWFTEPRPMVEGSRSVKACLPAMDQIAETWMTEISKHSVQGLLSVKITISTSGVVQNRQTQILCGHLVNVQGFAMKESGLKKLLITDVRFPKSNGTSTIILPLEFRRF